MTRHFGFIRMAALGLIALGLAACGPPAADSGAGGQPKDLGSAFSSGFDKGFNDSFAKGAKDSCVKSAVTGGAAASTAESYCSCFVEQLAPLPVKEKMNLKPDSEAVKNADKTCKAKLQ